MEKNGNELMIYDFFLKQYRQDHQLSQIKDKHQHHRY
jgi:hypothetical protein